MKQAGIKTLVFFILAIALVIIYMVLELVSPEHMDEISLFINIFILAAFSIIIVFLYLIRFKRIDIADKIFLTVNLIYILGVIFFCLFPNNLSIFPLYR